ncbi:hypothetical protein [Streptomyces longispororuber]|uniref:hypothetical protein n=1 Tax=Streptomyces longispororuber TaxID=68230 RepID=UPI00210DB5FB|nr:hypothetical protein [Streptomyces longispororuber]MCQ4210505.1 hypothetical protein [Streptomyces longispororuber]
MSGNAQIHGPVIQAGYINGDVNVRTAPPPPEVPLLASFEYHGSPDSFQLEDGTQHQLGLGVRVLIEGLTTQAVILKRLRPVVLSRTPPRPAARFFLTVGILEVRGFTTDLDRESPSLTPLEPHLPDFPFTVSSSDPELFEIHPRSQFDVTWSLELDWSSAGRQGTVAITGPEPFQYWANPPSAERGSIW